MRTEDTELAALAELEDEAMEMRLESGDINRLMYEIADHPSWVEEPAEDGTPIWVKRWPR